MDENIVDTGLKFKGYAFLLGPSPTGKKPDVLALTQLDRFLKKKFPELKFWRKDDEGFAEGCVVKGALPEKKES